METKRVERRPEKSEEREGAKVAGLAAVEAAAEGGKGRGMETLGLWRCRWGRRGLAEVMEKCGGGVEEAMVRVWFKERERELG